jgi:hypothetical protein
MATTSYGRAAPANLAVVRSLLMDCALPAEDVHKHLDHFVTAKDGEHLVGVIGLELLGQPCCCAPLQSCPGIVGRTVLSPARTRLRRRAGWRAPP